MKYDVMEVAEIAENIIDCGELRHAAIELLKANEHFSAELTKIGFEFG